MPLPHERGLAGVLRDLEGAVPSQIFVCDVSRGMGLVWLLAAGDFAACLKELLFVLALGANPCEAPVCPQRPSCILLPNYLNTLPRVFIMCLRGALSVQH